MYISYTLNYDLILERQNIREKIIQKSCSSLDTNMNDQWTLNYKAHQ